MWKCLYYTFVLDGISAGHNIPCLKRFPFKTWTVLFHCLLKTAVCFIAAPLKVRCVFVLWLLLRFFLFFFLMFSSLTVMCLGVICFVFILLGVCRASRVCDLMSFISFGKFWSFLCILLLLCSRSPLLLGLQLHTLDLLLLFYCSLYSFLYFPSFLLFVCQSYRFRGDKTSLNL